MVPDISIAIDISSAPRFWSLVRDAESASIRSVFTVHKKASVDANQCIEASATKPCLK